LIIRNYLKQARQTHKKPILEEGFVFVGTLEREKADRDMIFQGYTPTVSVHAKDPHLQVGATLRGLGGKGNKAMPNTLSSHYEYQVLKTDLSPVNKAALIAKDCPVNGVVDIKNPKPSLTIEEQLLWLSCHRTSTLSRSATTKYPKVPKPSFLLSRLNT
jgi:hypothetical protein